MSDARSQADLDAAIARVALEDPTWMQHPEVLDDPARAAMPFPATPLPALPFFAGIRFFAVTDPTEKPGTAGLIVAVTDDGTVRPIRSLDDYNQIIVDTGRTINSASDARDVAEQYVRLLGTTYPQYPESIRILQSADEIPVDAGESIPERLRTKIQPPRVQQGEDAFVVSLSVWTEVGGTLTNFDVRLSASGITALDETVSGEGIGKHWLPK
jgi:hypothetical protein